MTVGRKKRLSHYMSATRRKTLNLHTRRSKISTVLRDFRKLASAKTNKRVKKH